jgi:hypothetical protein
MVAPRRGFRPVGLERIPVTFEYSACRKNAAAATWLRRNAPGFLSALSPYHHHTRAEFVSIGCLTRISSITRARKSVEYGRAIDCLLKNRTNVPMGGPSFGVHFFAGVLWGKTHQIFSKF